MTTRRTAVDDLQRAATIPLILGAPLQSEHARHLSHREMEPVSSPLESG